MLLEDNWQELVYSLHPVGPGNWAQVVGLGSKCCYMLSISPALMADFKERRKIIISITCLGKEELQFLRLTYLRGKGRAGKRVTEGQREALFSSHTLHHLWVLASSLLTLWNIDIWISALTCHQEVVLSCVLPNVILLSSYSWIASGCPGDGPL